ncbi:hypothetical protein BS17DRAFT_302291 [Gyrodon lividus]|nr:hypothetical protein BS17DRAFT_302291 [Gyrodon lividus]
MAAAFTRNLTFMANDLGVDATLILTFDKDITGLYHDKLPVFWKSYNFGAKGSHVVNATYQSGQPQVGGSSGTIVDASTDKPLNVSNHAHTRELACNTIQVGDKTPLTEDTSTVSTEPNSDEKPTSVPPLEPVSDVGSLTETQVAPILRAYVTEQYRETDTTKSEIDSPLLWEHDLLALPQITIWLLTRNKATGQYRITGA